MGSRVMTFLAASMLAEKLMAAPFWSSSARVRMLARSALASGAPLASLRSASSKLMVMSVAASVTVAALAGLKVGAAGGVTSTVKVAVRRDPLLPAASQCSALMAT